MYDVLAPVWRQVPFEFLEEVTSSVYPPQGSDSAQRPLAKATNSQAGL